MRRVRSCNNMMCTTGGVVCLGGGDAGSRQGSACGPLSARQKEIILVGRKTDPGMKDLLMQIHGWYMPNKTVIVVDRTEEVGSEKVPAAARGKTAIDGKPIALISLATSPALIRSPSGLRWTVVRTPR